MKMTELDFAQVVEEELVDVIGVLADMTGGNVKALER
jgi:hypothetical protein